jgi:hypothetical protein
LPEEDGLLQSNRAGDAVNGEEELRIAVSNEVIGHSVERSLQNQGQSYEVIITVLKGACKININPSGTKSAMRS